MIRTLVGALALATTAAVVLPAASAEAKPAWRVTISANKTTMTLGHKVYLHGHVRPTAVGKYVRLEEQFAPGKPWKLQRQARIKSDGTYTTWDKPTQNHSRLYRVVMPATSSHARGISPTVLVNVYKWVQLTSMPAINEHGFFPQASVNINGTTYPGSLQGAPASPTATDPTPTPVSVEYNVNHKCTAFRATFGLSDSSETGAQGSVDLLVDGTTTFTGSFAVGQSTFWQTTFTTAPLKLHFDAQTQSTGVSSFPAVGTPQALCTQ
jgi:hypothetical protein